MGIGHVLTLLHRKAEPTWAPPSCMCRDIEAKVRDAIAIRDEMATWRTPLECWLDLQVFKPLAAEPQPPARAIPFYEPSGTDAWYAHGVYPPTQSSPRGLFGASERDPVSGTCRIVLSDRERDMASPGGLLMLDDATTVLVLSVGMDSRGTRYAVVQPGRYYVTAP